MKIGLFVCGMILGVLASFLIRPMPIQAQNSNAGGFVRVEQANIGMTTVVGTREVVGFSCMQVEGAVRCFLASR
jgi:hypothetical protein